MTKQTSQGFQALKQLLPEDKREAVASEKPLNPELEKEANGLRSYLLMAKNKHDKRGQAITLSKLGTLYRKHGEYQIAIKYFQQILTIEKDNVYAFDGLGVTYFKMGDYDQAIKYFQRELNPTVALANLARCYRYKGDYEMAINYLMQVLNKGEDNQITINELGINYRLLGEYDKSIFWFKEGLNLSENDKHFLDGLAITYRDKGCYEEAIECFKKLLIIEPKSIQGIDGLAITYRNKGDYWNAIRWFKKILSLSPNDKKSLDGLGMTYREQGDYKRSIECFERIISIDPFDQPALNSLGIIYRELGNYSESIKWFKKLFELDKKNKQTIDGLGITCRCQGDYKEAIRWFEKILEIDPKDKQAIFGLAITYSENDDFISAIKTFESLISLYPNDDYVYNGLKSVYQRMPANDKSIALLKHRLHVDLYDTYAANKLQEISDIYEAIGSLEKAKKIVEFLHSLEKHYNKADFSETLEQRVQRLENEIKTKRIELIRTQQLAALGSLSSGIAHELMQPLQIILMTAQNCLSDIEKGQITEIKTDLTEIIETSKRIDKIITHLHLLSQDKKPQVEAVNVNQVINDSLLLFNRQLQTRSITIQLNLADTLPTIQADKIQLEQVLINLINNARDALDKAAHKQISIKTHTDNTQVIIEVADNGIGMNEKQQSEIFQPFVTQKEKGVGLGLYLSKNIVEAYQGTIELQSKPECGTTFIIRFPITE